MIDLIRDNSKKIDDLKERIGKNQKRNRTQIWLTIILLGVLAKTALQNEKEITKIKKSIKELQSKGE